MSQSIVSHLNHKLYFLHFFLVNLFLAKLSLATNARRTPSPQRINPSNFQKSTITETH